MSKFKLIEKDNFIINSDLNEEFPTYEEAYERMRLLYREFAIEGNIDTIIAANITDTTAFVKDSYGTCIEWFIEEL